MNVSQLPKALGISSSEVSVSNTDIRTDMYLVVHRKGSTSCVFLTLRLRPS